MLDFQYELEQLKEGNREPEIIVSLIKKHEPRAAEMKAQYERYKTKEVPIYDRELSDPMRISNSINNDFVSEIVDTKVGYFAGTPVAYVTENHADVIEEFSEKNRLADLDAEVTKFAGICGYGARLQYIETKYDQARARVKNVFPWESILLGDDGIDETDFAVRYYEVQIEDNKTEKRAELYEPLKMTEYRSGDDGEYKFHKEHPHTYERCPMWGYENNEEHISDVEKVIKLIDAYDKALSDVNGELEAFRSAYLAFFGVSQPRDPETGEDIPLSENGMFFFDGRGDAKQDAKFIVKDIQDGAIEHHLERLHNNIYRFSKTPDLSDEAFGGNVTGVAAKYKLLGLENKTATFERKFRSSSIRMFEILATSLKYKGMNIDPYKIEMKFTRNFPQDLLDAAKIQTEFKGNVSERYRISLLPGVVNVEDEINELHDDEDAYMEKMIDQETRLGGGSDDGEGTGSAGKGKATS